MIHHDEGCRWTQPLTHALSDTKTVNCTQNTYKTCENSCTTSSSPDLWFPGDPELKVVAHADIGVLWKGNKKYKQQ